MKEIVGSFSGNNYKTFIRYAFQKSKAFMFVVCKYDGNSSFNQKVKPLVRNLSPYEIKKRKDKRWPGVITQDMRTYILHFYKCCSETEDILLASANDLYDWNYPCFPEDLSFYRANGLCWFYSITHEQCAFLESEEPDDIRFMKKNLGLEIRDIDSLSLEDELAQPFIERL